jgi:hypothetical protein
MPVPKIFILSALLVIMACCCNLPTLVEKLDIFKQIEPTGDTEMVEEMEELEQSETAAPTDTTSPEVIQEEEIPPVAPSGTILYQEDGVFSIHYPKSWQVSHTGGWVDFCSENLSAEVCVHVQPHKGYDRLDTFSNDVYQGFLSSVSGYEVLEREKVFIMDEPYVLLLNCYTFHDVYHQGYAVYLVHNGTGFQIHGEIKGQLPTEEYDRQLQIIKESILTFKALN